MTLVHSSFLGISSTHMQLHHQPWHAQWTGTPLAVDLTASQIEPLPSHPSDLHAVPSTANQNISNGVSLSATMTSQAKVRWSTHKTSVSAKLLGGPKMTATQQHPTVPKANNSAKRHTKPSKRTTQPMMKTSAKQHGRQTMPPNSDSEYSRGPSRHFKSVYLSMSRKLLSKTGRTLVPPQLGPRQHT